MRSQTEEDRALRKLRLLVDTASHVLAAPTITLGETMRIIYNTRTKAILMFPDKAETFDMIYGRRFIRILEHKGMFFSSRVPFWN